MDIVGKLVLDPSDVKGKLQPRRLEVRGVQLAIGFVAFMVLTAIVRSFVGRLQPREFGSPLLGSLFFVLPAAMGWLTRWQLERVWLRGHGEGPLETSYELTPEHVRVVNHARDTRLPLSLVRKVGEGSTEFLLYGGAQIALEVLPKRAFTEPDLARLRTLFADRLTPVVPPALTFSRRTLLRPTLWAVLALVIAFVLVVLVFLFTTH